MGHSCWLDTHVLLTHFLILSACAIILSPNWTQGVANKLFWWKYLKCFIIEMLLHYGLIKILVIANCVYLAKICQVGSLLPANWLMAAFSWKCCWCLNILEVMAPYIHSFSGTDQPIFQYLSNWVASKWILENGLQNGKNTYIPVWKAKFVTKKFSL